MIDLAPILARLNRIVTVISTILGILGIIQGNTEKVAQENVPFIIDTNTSITVAAVTDGTIGLAAIKAELDTLTTDVAALAASVALATDLAAISGQLAALSGSLPPAWVTPIGNAVWGWPVPTRGNLAYTHLTNAGDAAEQRGFPQVEEVTPFSDAMWVVIGTWGQEGVDDPNPGSTFFLDVTTILASDATSADWLNRVYTTQPWLPPFPNGCLGLDDATNSNWSWVVDLPIDKWLQLKTNLGLSAQSVSAPVWPGLANVTLGTPVSITTGLTITEPMDGVIVEISSVLGSKPFFDFDGNLSYRNIGALAFQDDNSNEELPQTLGFTSAVYCPKNMVRAQAVVVRADSAVIGTVTPWVVT